MTANRLVCAIALLLGAVALGGAACADDDRCCPTGGDCNGFSLGGLREHGTCGEMQDVDSTGSHLEIDKNGCPVVVGTGSCLDWVYDTGRPVFLDDADAAEAETLDAAEAATSDAADAG